MKRSFLALISSPVLSFSDRTETYRAISWRSRTIASMDKRRHGFAQRFGYWSARIKMLNAGQGAWSAFWLASVSRHSQWTK